MTRLSAQIGGLVRQHTEALQYQLGGITDRAVAGDSSKAAARPVGIFVAGGNGLGPLDVPADDVQLDGVGCSAAAVRGDVAAVISADSHPLGAAGTLRVGSVCAIVVGHDLQLAVHSADTTGPLPLITDKVGNTAGAVVVVPSQRAGAGSGASGLAAVVIGLDSLVELLRTVLAVVVVAQRDKALHLADAHQQTPLHAGHAVPAVTFCLTVAAGLVKVHACGGVNAGQTVRTAILHDVQILGDVDFVHFLPVDDKRREQCGGFAHTQLGIGHLRDADHNAGLTGVVQQDLIVRADRFQCGCHQVKIISHRGLPPYSMLHSVSVTVSMSSGSGSLAVVCCGV